MNDPLSLPLPLNAYVNVSPLSTSKPEKVPIVEPVGSFSRIVLLLKVRPYGVSFTSTISTVNSLVLVNPPLSVTLTYKVYKLLTSWLKTSALDNTPPLVNEKELLSG